MKMLFLAMRLLLAEADVVVASALGVLLDMSGCWVIFGLLVFFGVLGVLSYAPAERAPNVCEISTATGRRTHEIRPYSVVPNA